MRSRRIVSLLATIFLAILFTNEPAAQNRSVLRHAELGAHMIGAVTCVESPLHPVATVIYACYRRQLLGTNCAKGRPEAALSYCQFQQPFFTPNVARAEASLAP